MTLKDYLSRAQHAFECVLKEIDHRPLLKDRNPKVRKLSKLISSLKKPNLVTKSISFLYDFLLHNENRPLFAYTLADILKQVEYITQILEITNLYVEITGNEPDVDEFFQRNRILPLENNDPDCEGALLLPKQEILNAQEDNCNLPFYATRLHWNRLHCLCWALCESGVLIHQSTRFTLSSLLFGDLVRVCMISLAKVIIIPLIICALIMIGGLLSWGLGGSFTSYMSEPTNIATISVFLIYGACYAMTEIMLHLHLRNAISNLLEKVDIYDELTPRSNTPEQRAQAPMVQALMALEWAKHVKNQSAPETSNSNSTAKVDMQDSDHTDIAKERPNTVLSHESSICSSLQPNCFKIS